MSNEAIRVLRLPEVKALTGLSRSTIYDEMKAGRFPQAVKLTGDPKNRAIGWSSAAVNAWIAARFS